MKRPVLHSEPGYPSVVQPTASRRGFLAAILGGAAGTLVGGRDARAQGRGLTRVDLELIRREPISGCELVAEKLIVQTRDARLVELIRKGSEHAGLETVVLAVIRAVTCADVTDRKRLAAVEGKLARALSAHYRARTRRMTPVPIVTLVLAKRRPFRLEGLMAAPAAPVPRP